jgi:pyrroline-5-carboxylate reductase
MKIAVIGVGEMGGAIVKGLLKSDACKAEEITISAPHKQTLDKFKDSGVSMTTDNKVAAEDAEVVMVVVKPNVAEAVLQEIKPVLDYKKQQLVLVVAGMTAEKASAILQKGQSSLPPFYLVVPNIAIAVKASMTFVVPVETTAEQQKKVIDLFNNLGTTLITQESLLSAGTTLASCGIAYAMRYIRAASEGGVELGFKAQEAQRIVMQTMKGAVTLLEETGDHPEAAIDKVTTAGGITIRGLNEMEHAGFSSAVIRGLKASS